MSSKRRDKDPHKLVPFPESIYEDFKTAVEGKISLRAYKDSDKAEEEIIKGALYSSVREAVKVIKFDGNFQNYGDVYVAYKLIDKLGVARIPISLLVPLLSEAKKGNTSLYKEFMSKAEKFGETVSSFLKSQVSYNDPRELLKYINVLAPHMEIINMRVSEDLVEMHLKVLNASEEVIDLSRSLLSGFMNGLGMTILDFDVGGEIITLKAIRGRPIPASGGKGHGKA